MKKKEVAKSSVGHLGQAPIRALGTGGGSPGDVASQYSQRDEEKPAR